jgi:hypothetical protein
MSSILIYCLTNNIPNDFEGMAKLLVQGIIDHGGIVKGAPVVLLSRAFVVDCGSFTERGSTSEPETRDN